MEIFVNYWGTKENPCVSFINLSHMHKDIQTPDKHFRITQIPVISIYAVNIEL